MLKDNASPKAGNLYAALDMPFAVLVGQLAGIRQALNRRQKLRHHVRRSRPRGR